MSNYVGSHPDCVVIPKLSAASVWRRPHPSCFPSVMSAPIIRKRGLPGQLYTPPFGQRTIVHLKPWQTMDADVGSSHEPCVLTPAVYLLDATRQKTPVVLLQLGIPNILRHSVTCVQIFMGPHLKKSNTKNSWFPLRNVSRMAILSEAIRLLMNFIIFFITVHS